jgi:hypothetical protein
LQQQNANATGIKYVSKVVPRKPKVLNRSRVEDFDETEN